MCMYDILTLDLIHITLKVAGNFQKKKKRCKFQGWAKCNLPKKNNFLKSNSADIIFSLFFNTDMSAISVMWTVLSVILLFTCTLALFSPFWHEHIPDPMSTNNSETFAAFGLLRFCFQEQFVTLQEINEWRGSKYCSFYDRIFPGIPSVFWKVAAISYATALVLLFVALLLAHISCCRKFVCGKSLVAIAAVIQSIAGNHLLYYP